VHLASARALLLESVTFDSHQVLHPIFSPILLRHLHGLRKRFHPLVPKNGGGAALVAKKYFFQKLSNKFRSILEIC